MRGHLENDVPQNSTAFIRAATYDPSPLPDFTATLKLNAVPDQTHFDIQFNFLGPKYWPQVVAVTNSAKDTTTGDVGDYMGWTQLGEGDVKIAGNYGESSYLAEPINAPFVVVFGSDIPNSRLFSGEVKLHLELKGLQVTLQYFDATGVLKEQSWTLTEEPYIVACEVTSAALAGYCTFHSFDAALDYLFSAPVQVFMSKLGFLGSEFQWGTHAEPTLYGGKALPLFWMDETGESSNLWTNIVAQNPIDLAFNLSLIEGRQTPSNPPIAQPPPVIVPPTPPPPPQVTWFGRLLPWLRHALHLD
jgi:hypothetical protein